MNTDRSGSGAQSASAHGTQWLWGRYLPAWLGERKGAVEHAFGCTFIATDGTNLNLAEVTFGRFNVFTERAPLQSHGSFRLI